MSTANELKKEKLTSLSEQVAKEESKLSGVKSELAHAEKELDEFRSSLDKKKESAMLTHKEQADFLDAEIEKKKDILRDINEETDKEKKKGIIFHETNSKYILMNEHLSSTISSTIKIKKSDILILEKEILEKTCQHDALFKELRFLSESAEQARKNFLEIRGAVVSAEEIKKISFELHSLRAEEGTILENIKNKKDELFAKEREMDKIVSQKKWTEADEKRMDMKWAEHLDNVKNLGSEMKSLFAVKEITEKLLEKTQEEHRSKTDLLESTKREIEQVVSEHKQKSEDYQKLCENYTTVWHKKDALEKSLALLEKKWIEAKQGVIHEQNKAKGISDSKDNIKKNYDDLIAKKKSEYESLLSEYGKTETKKAEAMKEFENLISLILEKKNLHDSEHNKCHTMIELKKNLESDISSLSSEIIEKKKEKGKILTEMNELKLENMNVVKEAKRLENRVSALKERYKNELLKNQELDVKNKK